MKICYFIFLFYFQSQPCHWRNAKNVVKRSVAEDNSLPTMVTVPPTLSSLSQNVNLFQSLRVLQEGEDHNEAALVNSKYNFYYYNFHNRAYTSLMTNFLDTKVVV